MKVSTRTDRPKLEKTTCPNCGNVCVRETYIAMYMVFCRRCTFYQILRVDADATYARARGLYGIFRRSSSHKYGYRTPYADTRLRPLRARRHYPDPPR